MGNQPEKSTPNEPAHEIMALFVLRKLILQTRMPSHPVGLDVWFFVKPFVYFHTSCVWTVKALARLRECTGLSEPLLVAYVISTIISRAGSIIDWTNVQFNDMTKYMHYHIKLEIRKQQIKGRWEGGWGYSHIRAVQVCAARKPSIFRSWPLLKTSFSTWDSSKRPPFQKYTFICSTLLTWAAPKDPPFKKYVSLLFLVPKSFLFFSEGPLWKPPIFGVGPLPRPPPHFQTGRHIYTTFIYVYTAGTITVINTPS